MKISDIYKKIISKEPYNDTNVFVANYESFEEIPIVSRYQRLNPFMKELGCDGVRKLLISLSVFALNTALIVSKSKNTNNIFYAITFTSFDRYKKDKFMIPKIFIYPEAHKLGFLEKLRQRSAASSSEMRIVNSLFEEIGIAVEFDILESRFYDTACNEEFVRVYVIPKGQH
jgi:hypothetical protein